MGTLVIVYRTFPGVGMCHAAEELDDPLKIDQIGHHLSEKILCTRYGVRTCATEELSTYFLVRLFTPGDLYLSSKKTISIIIKNGRFCLGLRAVGTVVFEKKSKPIFGVTILGLSITGGEPFVAHLIDDESSKLLPLHHPVSVVVNLTPRKDTHACARSVVVSQTTNSYT